MKSKNTITLAIRVTPEHLQKLNSTGIRNKSEIIRRCIDLVDISDLQDLTVIDPVTDEEKAIIRKEKAKDRVKKWRQNNPEKVAASQKRWNDKNRGEYTREYKVRDKFKMTDEDSAQAKNFEISKSTGIV